MGTRLELQSKLEELLGSRQVYYQPPESVKMEYPAIVYSKSNIRTTNANDAKYSKINRYDKQSYLRNPKIQFLISC